MPASLTNASVLSKATFLAHQAPVLTGAAGVATGVGMAIGGQAISAAGATVSTAGAVGMGLSMVAGIGLIFASGDQSEDTGNAISGVGMGFMASLGALLAGQVLIVAGQMISVAGIVTSVGSGALATAGLVRHGLVYKQERELRLAAQTAEL